MAARVSVQFITCAASSDLSPHSHSCQCLSASCFHAREKLCSCASPEASAPDAAGLGEGDGVGLGVGDGLGEGLSYFTLSEAALVSFFPPEPEKVQYILLPSSAEGIL